MRKLKMKQRDMESPANGGETAPTTLQESKQSAPRQEIMHFGDILDIIINISDEEWMSLTKDQQNGLTKMEFAHLCSAISKSAMKQYLPTLKKTEAASKSSSAMTEKNIQIKREARETSNPDAAAVTGKIVMVVLDVMDGSSTAKVDLGQTGDLLMAAAERLKHMASTSSRDRLTSRTHFLGAQKAQEEFYTKATRAVSQELLSHISVWEMDGSSELPNSLGGQLIEDSELEAMTQAGFPTDSVLSHLDSTSREIVQTIAENMDVLSSASDSHSEEKHKCNTAEDSGLLFNINHVFSTISEKVKRLFNVAKHPENEYSELLSKNNVTQAVSDFLVNSDSRQTSRGTITPKDWDLGTGPCSSTCSSRDLQYVAASIAGAAVDALDSLVESRVMDSNSGSATIVSALDSFSGSSKVSQVHKSVSLASSVPCDGSICKEEKSCSFITTPHVKQPSVTRINDLKDLLTEASRVVSDVLITRVFPEILSAELRQDDSISTSLQNAAGNIAGTVVEALESLVESRVIDSSSDSAAIVSALDSFSFVSSAYSLSGSDIASIGCVLPPCSLFQRVQGYLQALFMGSSPLKFESLPTVSSSALQLSKDCSVSLVDDLTVTCTDNIFREITNAYFSEISPDFETPVGPKGSEENLVSHWEMHGIMQGLERITCSRSLSRNSVTNRDLGGRKDVSFSKIDSDFDDDIPLDCSSDQVEEFFSSQFQNKATQVVSDLLLATREKLDAATQCSMASSPVVSKTHVQSTLEEVTEPEPPSVAAPSSSTEAKSAASEIVTFFLKRLRRLSSSAQSEKTRSLTGPSSSQRNFLSVSHSIYRALQKRVLGFLLGLQELSTKRDTSPHANTVEAVSVLSLSAMPSRVLPRIEVNIDQCTLEVIGKVVEFYRSEVLLSKSKSFKVSQIHKSTSWQLGNKLRHFFTSLNTSGQLEVKASERQILASRLETPDFALNQPKSLICHEADIFRVDSLKSISPSMLCHSPTHSSGLSASLTFSDQDMPTSSADVKGQQMNISGLSMKCSHTSVTALSRGASALVRETLDTDSISSQKGLSHCSSASPVNKSCAKDPVPVDLKRRRLGFRFIIPKKAPKICVHRKKSNKVNPACLVPDDHKPCSSSGHLQESSHLEPRVKTSSSSRTKCCKLLSQMCSAISKCLPNPFKCMARRPS